MSHESTRLIKSGPSKTFPACHLQHPKNRQHKGRHSEGDFAFCRFVLVLSRVVYTCSDWKGVLPLIIGTGSSTPEVESLTGSHATEHSDFLQAFLLSDRLLRIGPRDGRTDRQLCRFSHEELGLFPSCPALALLAPRSVACLRGICREARWDCGGIDISQNFKTFQDKRPRSNMIQYRIPST